MINILNFVELCKMFSDQVNMIQAGGGNASTKDETKMMIKASGFLLSDVTQEVGHTQIDLLRVRNLIDSVECGEIDSKEEETIKKIMDSLNEGVSRPSIETFLHAMLDSKFVLHLHSLVALIYASSDVFATDLVAQKQNKFSEEFLLVGYSKPGIELALKMKTGLEQYKKIMGFEPSCIILQNHGIIVSSDSLVDIERILFKVLDYIKNYMNINDDFDLKYRKQNELRKLLKEILPSESISLRVCEDVDIIRLFSSDQEIKTLPVFPDAVVYCGIEPIAAIEIGNYFDHYKEYPKVILYRSEIFFAGENIKKCLEAQEVFKIQAILYATLKMQLITLSEENAVELMNWEAEKYRKSL